MSADSLSSADASATLSSFGADVNVAATVPTGESKARGPCRRIRINAGSALAMSVQYAGGCTDTITGLSAGDHVDGKIVKILTTGTTVTSVTVYW